MQCDKIRGKIIKFFGPLANLNLFIKMGMVITICIAVNSILSFYLYSKLKLVYNVTMLEPFENYESLSRIALRKIGAIIVDPDLTSHDTINTLNQLEELLNKGLNGGAFSDFSGNVLIQRIKFKDIPDYDAPKEFIKKAKKAVETLIKSADEEKNVEVPFSIDRKKLIQDLHNQIIALQNWAVETQRHYKTNIFNNISNISSYIWIILAVLIAFLVWGALAFIFMVVQPINAVIKKISDLAFGRNDNYDEEFLECYFADDEIGKLVTSVNDLIVSYQNLTKFKHLIEEDENIEDVYERLASVFKDEIHLPSFAIYQVSNSQNTMTLMAIYPDNLEINHSKLLDASLCRAKRTGHNISSLQSPGICKSFLWKYEANHYCIPMISSGECVGIAQFILPMEKETRRGMGVYKKLRMAERYINEAIPVLEAKRYAQSLKEQTFKDPLTGLFNRRFLDSIIDNLVAGIIRRNTNIGILMADIDFFKSINDKYGHDAGDIVLTDIAAVLKSNIRKSDMVIRFGGEEFLVLLVDIKQGESERVAEKIRSGVEQHKINVPNSVIQKTISIGVSEFPIDTNEIWKAIKFADVALYKAKDSGRNKVVRFKPDMWEVVDEEDY